LKAANLGEACCLLVAIPDAFEGGQVVEQARAANANLLIVARAHSDEEVAHLASHGASDVVMGEFEIAKAMIEDVRRLELPEQEESKEEEAAKGSAHLAEAPSTA
jgi:CPA2 family monovalent cation:H+ antiporter-2